MIWIMIIMIVALALIGVPMSFSMLTGSVWFMLTSGMPQTLMIQRLIMAVGDSFSMLAIPFFMLAGTIMNAGGVATRIFDFCNTLVGHIPGGLGHVNVFCSVIFAGMSGSAAAGSCPHGKQLMTHSSEITARRQYVHFFLIYSSCHSGNVYEILYTILSIIAHSARDVKGNTAQRLCGRCVVKFFVR